MSEVPLRWTAHGRPDAPALVLGNALGTTTAMWAEQIEPLSSGFRVVCLDYDYVGSGRRHGGGKTSVRTLALDILHLLDALGVRRFDFCGVSLGGLIGLWLASHKPGRVGRLIVACSNPWTTPARPWLERADRVRREGMQAIVESVMERWFTPEYRRQHRERWQQLRAMLLSIPAEEYAAGCEAIARSRPAAALRRVNVPVRVIAGEQDAVAPPHVAQRVAAELSSADVAVIPGAAHLANVERPAEFNAALLSFLAPEAGHGNISPKEGVS